MMGGGYPWLKTACQSSMLSKSGSLVNFTIVHSNYLVTKTHEALSERCQYSVHSWAMTNLCIDTIYTLHGALD